LRDILGQLPIFVVGNLLLAAHYVMLDDTASAVEQIRYVLNRTPTFVFTNTGFNPIYNWRELAVQQRLENALLRAQALAVE